jgi:hypothetical protein
MLLWLVICTKKCTQDEDIRMGKHFEVSIAAIVKKSILFLIFGVCILLRVWDQGEGFSSTQRYYSSFFIFINSFICYMFWP